MLSELDKALAGRPRQRDLVDAEVTDLIGGEGGGEMIAASAAAGLLDDDDDDNSGGFDEEVCWEGRYDQDENGACVGGMP